MLDELNRSGRVKKGDRILLMVPESARFSYAYALLTVC
jgi:3-oxoacyl-[acyl-carrier-protein] synthase-3